VCISNIPNFCLSAKIRKNADKSYVGIRCELSRSASHQAIRSSDGGSDSLFRELASCCGLAASLLCGGGVLAGLQGMRRTTWLWSEIFTAM
jgi:hypothetical protein